MYLYSKLVGGKDIYILDKPKQLYSKCTTVLNQPNAIRIINIYDRLNIYKKSDVSWATIRVLR